MDHIRTFGSSSSNGERINRLDTRLSPSNGINSNRTGSEPAAVIRCIWPRPIDWVSLPNRTYSIRSHRLILSRTYSGHQVRRQGNLQKNQGDPKRHVVARRDPARGLAASARMKTLEHFR